MNQAENRSGITLLGLGPGDPNELTRAAWDLLGTRTTEVYVRSRSRAIAQLVPPGIEVVACDSLAGDADPDQMPGNIVALHPRVGQAPAQGVVYAIPGHPMELADSIGIEIMRLAQQKYITCLWVIPGISLANQCARCQNGKRAQC